MVIANSSFDQGRLAKRDGTEVDVQKLKKVFIWLSFKVVVYENLSSQVSYSRLSRTTELISTAVYIHFLGPCCVGFFINILVTDKICSICPSVL